MASSWTTRGQKQSIINKMRRRVTPTYGTQHTETLQQPIVNHLFLAVYMKFSHVLWRQQLSISYRWCAQSHEGILYMNDDIFVPEHAIQIGHIFMHPSPTLDPYLCTWSAFFSTSTDCSLKVNTDIFHDAHFTHRGAVWICDGVFVHKVTSWCLLFDHHIL